MYEDNLDYASGRLLNTFLQHNGEAIYVTNISPDDDFVPSASVLYSDGRVRAIPLKELSHLPIPLGYVPQTTSHYYLERLPRRKWKQGIHQENTVCIRKDGGQGGIEFSMLQALVKGNYAPKEEAIAKGGAFSPSFFVHKKTDTLWYRGQFVGDIKEGRIVLNAGKEYLHRRLEKTQ